MAIRDLLWACPLCGAVSGLRRVDGRERCRACGTEYRRGAGSRIVAFPVGRPRLDRSSVEWLAGLPPIEPFPDGGASRETRVSARFAGVDVRVRWRGELLGFREALGEPVAGVLRLTPDRLEFQALGGELHGWSLGEITGVQPSSSTVQVKPRHEGVVGFRFTDESPRLWEELLGESLRRWYRRAGRGEVIEFQPRVVCG